ncbi:DUF883 family protein [Leptospira kirschneri]|uniref:PF05957 family protein n=2 Tax=Leptospira kirschneri TaxID=29507 RepID=A0A0E2B1T3_9LEPT|nr:DUF883 family protein [Leptospira kirschneri]EKO15213.1 PF05957 family protein [Leptospira kirschneri str. H1]EKO60151.1 PF05957 family protein [Leptospira kirschneri str. H2]EMK24651.1 PF05957 family protein [Leptospira kirschneri serovar Bulgarica str. Nikolaevo]UML78483.1 DUF883 family protein [Leptospira kirschneri]
MVSKTEDFNEEVESLKDKAKKITGKAREEYLEHVSDFKEKIKQISGDTSERAKQIIDETGAYIKENPQKAALIGLGVGLGIGLLVGMLIRRK